MSYRARALYFTAPGRVELRPVLLAPAAGQLVVTTEVTAISAGTELLLFRGLQPTELSADATISTLAGDLQYPLPYGYSAVGRAEDGLRYFAFHPHQDLFCVPAAEALKLPDDLHPEDAVLLPAVETAVSILHDAAPVLGDVALVVGQGVIGLLVTRLLLQAGCATVIAAEPRALRRRYADELGATVTTGEPREVADAVAGTTGGRGVDVAVNVSSTAAGAQLAIDNLAFSGALVEASWFGSQATSLDLGGAFHRRRLVLRSSQVSIIPPALAGRWNKERRLLFALRVLRRAQPRRYISHRFPLDRAAEAYRLLDSGADDVLQVVLTP